MMIMITEIMCISTCDRKDLIALSYLCCLVNLFCSHKPSTDPEESTNSVGLPFCTYAQSDKTVHWSIRLKHFGATTITVHSIPSCQKA